MCSLEKFEKQINVQYRACMLEKTKKKNKRACTFIRYFRVNGPGVLAEIVRPGHGDPCIYVSMMYGENNSSMMI